MMDVSDVDNYDGDYDDYDGDYDGDDDNDDNADDDDEADVDSDQDYWCNACGWVGRGCILINMANLSFSSATGVHYNDNEDDN